MQLTSFYHRHHLHRLAGHPNFRFFELAIWLHSLAQSLVWVFVPIILLQIGYSVRDILIYYLIFNIIDVPLNFVVAWLMRWIGARKVLIMGIVAVIAFFSLFNVLPPGNWPLLLALALLAAVYDTFFWISHIYIFTEINREKGLDLGKTTGALEAVRKLANIVGPIAGAFLLIVFGRSSLLVSSIILNVLSIFVFFKMRHINDIPIEPEFSFRKFFSGPKEGRDFFSLAFWGVHSEVDSVLWPIFIFIVFSSVGSVAAVPVIVSLTTAMLSYIAGKLTKKHAFKMIAVGSLLIGATWVLRLVFGNATLYYVTVFMMGFLSLLVIIPIDRSIVESGLEKGSLAAATYRNAVGMFARLVLYAILLLLLEVFKFSFGLAAASVIAIFLVTWVFARPPAKNSV
jgi:MFS family permease